MVSMFLTQIIKTLFLSLVVALAVEMVSCSSQEPACAGSQKTPCSTIAIARQWVYPSSPPGAGRRAAPAAGCTAQVGTPVCSVLTPPLTDSVCLCGSVCLCPGS